MFYKIFLSPQMKRWTITTYEHGIYELPHELPNDLRPHDIFATGGGLGVHTRKKKKTKDFRKSGNITKVSKPH